MTLFIFILILSILVLIHELGHFFAAKKLGVRVEEFGWGLPPRVFSKKIGDTIYSLNLLPFGGFVRLCGEDLESDAPVSVQDPQSFIAKTPLQRFIIVFAGVVMNFLLTCTLFYIYFFITNFKTEQIPLLIDYKFRFGEVVQIDTVVSALQENSPAALAGIEPGEAILSIDGVKVIDVANIRRLMKEKNGMEVVLELQDVKGYSPNPIVRTVVLTPILDADSNPVLGVFLTKAVSISYSKPIEKILVGPLHSYNVMAYSLTAFGKLISTAFKTKDFAPMSQSVSGPVGIYQVIGGILTYGGTSAWLTLLDYTALMSLSLAFMNILPFPALDGGRLVFLAVEGVFRKKINPKYETALHKFGMLILLMLIVLVTVKDLLH